MIIVVRQAVKSTWYIEAETKMFWLLNCMSWYWSELPLIWWRHQIETFSALLDICAGNSPVTDEFPAQRPVTRRFDVFFDLRLNKRLSYREAGNLRRHGTHYDVIVRFIVVCHCLILPPWGLTEHIQQWTRYRLATWQCNVQRILFIGYK